MVLIIVLYMDIILYKKAISIIKKSLINQFIRYCFIGVVNTIVCFIAFYLFFLLMDVQSISLFLSTLVGLACSYYLNSRINFKTSTTLKKYMLFIVGMLVIGYGCGYIGDHWKLPLTITFLIQIIIGTPLGFLFSKYIIFKK